MNAIKEFLNSIISSLRAEREKLRPLTAKQKVEYIWEYYKVPILVTLFSVIALVSLITSIRKANAGGEVVFGVGIVNDLDTNTELCDYISTGFGEYLGLVYGEQQVYASTRYAVTNQGTEYEDVTNSMIFIDSLAGNVDAVICEEDVILYFSPTESPWVDLTTVLDAATLEALSDRLYYYTDTDETVYPTGIYLRDTHLCTDTTLRLADPILTFTGSAQHQEYIDEFVEYLLNP